MMRKNLFVILLACMAFSGVVAQEVTMEECERIRIAQKAPYYYCSCHLESDTVDFPMDRVVRDTVWFTATMSSIRKGLSAYWISEDSVTVDMFMFCTDKLPLMTMTIGGNKMHEIDAAEIQKRLDEMPKDIQTTLSLITPHLRVYPQGKGSGHVYCYPYNQGPISTCEAPFPLIHRMTYVCADEEEYVYRLDSAYMPSDGKAFIQWKQSKDQACEIRLTIDSCSGEEIGKATLSDSLHVYIVDSAMLVNAREANRPIWLQVTHEAGKPGRINYYAKKTFIEPKEPAEETECEGKVLKFNQREYTRDTAFVDTLWIKNDTLRTEETKLTFTKPQLEYDTLLVEYKELKNGYRATEYNITFYNYCDTLLEIKKKDTCTRRVLLSIREPQAIGDVKSVPSARKQIQNGKVCILVDDKKYNVLGQELKAENKTNNQ